MRPPVLGTAARRCCSARGAGARARARAPMIRPAVLAVSRLELPLLQRRQHWSHVSTQLGKACRVQVAHVAQQQSVQPAYAAAGDVAALRQQVEATALAGAKKADQAAQQLCRLSEGRAQANIAIADVQDALEEAGKRTLCHRVQPCIHGASHLFCLARCSA